VQRILVFCASSPGRTPIYTETARAFGELCAGEGLGIVYGGASVGLMGALADGALAAGGEVIGVIPRHLEDSEIAHAGLSELHVVGTMHERKALMLEKADAIVTLPGGSGTLDELFEAFTWAQLGLHDKPIGILDVGGYWDHLLAFLDHAVNERLLRAEHRESLIVEREAPALLARLRQFEYSFEPKWLDQPPSQ
jgi:uncharacterized protein (TIGR00730 family)